MGLLHLRQKNSGWNLQKINFPCFLRPRHIYHGKQDLALLNPALPAKSAGGILDYDSAVSPALLQGMASIAA